MQKDKNPIYSWEVVLNLCPFLTIEELARLASLSRQWNYMSRKYIAQSILPKEMQNGEEFKQLKQLFNRKLTVYRDNKEIFKKQYQLKLVLKKISVGRNYTALELYDGRYAVVETGKLLQGKVQEIKLTKNYSSIICFENILFCVDDKQLVRYNSFNCAEFDKIKPSIIDFPTSIDHILTSYGNSIVITGLDTQKPKIYCLWNNLQIYTSILWEGPININDLYLFKNQLFHIRDYSVQFLNLMDEKAEWEIFRPLKGKHIAHLKGGEHHMVAFQTNKKLLKDWNLQDVIAWAEEEGFQDYINIFKAEKVNGEKLLKMKANYITDVLGITNTKVQQKILLRIEANNKENPQDYIPHVWGQNNKGQLGPKNQLNVTNPIKLKLPENLIIWQCIGNFTLLKNTKTHQTLVNRMTEGKIEWERLTKQHIWAISGQQNDLLYITSEEKTIVPGFLSEQPSKKKAKLRTAKNIMDQICWDENLKKEDFRVGYLDKFTGMLESSFQELLTSEVKQYRIQYFKRGNQVVWDKKKRIDIL